MYCYCMITPIIQKKKNMKKLNTWDFNYRNPKLTITRIMDLLAREAVKRRGLPNTIIYYTMKAGNVPMLNQQEKRAFLAEEQKEYLMLSGYQKRLKKRGDRYTLISGHELIKNHYAKSNCLVDYFHEQQYVDTYAKKKWFWFVNKKNPRISYLYADSFDGQSAFVGYSSYLQDGVYSTEPRRLTCTIWKEDFRVSHHSLDTDYLYALIDAQIDHMVWLEQAIEDNIEKMLTYFAQQSFGKDFLITIVTDIAQLRCGNNKKMFASFIERILSNPVYCQLKKPGYYLLDKKMKEMLFALREAMHSGGFSWYDKVLEREELLIAQHGNKQEREKLRFANKAEMKMYKKMFARIPFKESQALDKRFIELLKNY